MPLSQLTEEFATAGFVIERLIEPTLESAMSETHSDPYDKLATEPAFVLFRLRPGPSSSSTPA